MELADYVQEVKRTCTADTSWHDVLFLAGLALNEEAGELAGLIKKHLFYGHRYDRARFVEEMGDLLWYFVYLANEMDLSLEEIMEANAKKLRAKFPNGWDPSRTLLSSPPSNVKHGSRKPRARTKVDNPSIVGAAVIYAETSEEEQIS